MQEEGLNPQKSQKQSKSIPEPTIKLKQEMETQQSYIKSQNSYIEKQACCFCSNQIKNENDGRRFACLHNFHEVCFEQKSPNSSSCPYCSNNLFEDFISLQPIFKIEEKKQEKPQPEKSIMIQRDKQQKQMCFFCNQQIGSENDGLRFACLHNFHETCFKLIAPDSSFCPYCPNYLFGNFMEPQPIKIEKKEQIILKNRSQSKKEKPQSEKQIMIQKGIQQQIIKFESKYQRENKIIYEKWGEEGMNQHRSKQHEPIIEQMSNNIICSFCNAQLTNQEQKEIFQCQHRFHKICFQSIAPNSSYCVYCPGTPRKNNKRQIRETCFICGQSIQIEHFVDHLQICQVQDNELCHYCQTQYPKNLITEHYKVCQMLKYYQNKSRLKEQIMIQRERQKQKKIKEKQQKLSQMKYMMQRRKFQNKQKIEKLFIELLAKDIATGQQDECMICIEKIQKGERISALKCRHIYHSQCLVSWGTKNFSCPACRKELQTKQQKIQEDDYDFDELF